MSAPGERGGTMRGFIGLVALGVVVGQMGAFAGTGDPVRESSFPAGGTMEIRGQEVKPGILRLEMGIVPLTGGIHVLGGVKVFAEPSHTLLALRPCSSRRLSGCRVPSGEG